MTCAIGLLNKSGDNLLSRCSHYHRPWMLNGRVRNGNGCGDPVVVTGKLLGQTSGEVGTPPAGRPVYQLVAAELVLSKGPWSRAPLVGVARTEQGINAVKRSAVSTGQLSALLHLHTRPIDPVVFREP